MPSEPKPGTPLPWRWTAEDDSMISLVGPDDTRDHVLSSQKCKSCTDGKRVCLQPSEQDAAYIVHACNTLAELQKPCVWKWEGKLACYTMSCGNSIGPVGTDLVRKPFKFCPYCQKPITESENDHE